MMDVETPEAGVGEYNVDRIVRIKAIEDFLYAEADAIDARQFEDWLDFFSEDIRYWVPIRKNLPFSERFNDMTGPREIAWIDDNRATLEARVGQVLTKIHWAEEPLSRVTHMVTNIRVEELGDDKVGATSTVRSKILVHRSRMDDAGEIIIGRREDKIRQTERGFEIFWRKIIIDQATLNAKNLSFFL